MDGGARRSEPGPEPGWGDARQAVIRAAEVLAVAMTGLSLHGGEHGPAMAVAREAVAILADYREMFRGAAADDATIEILAARRADEILARAGMAPPGPRPRHLHVV